MDELACFFYDRPQHRPLIIGPSTLGGLHRPPIGRIVSKILGIPFFFSMDVAEADRYHEAVAFCVVVCGFDERESRSHVRLQGTDRAILVRP